MQQQLLPSSPPPDFQAYAKAARAGVCRKCAAPLRWVLTAKKHPMPIDYSPVDGGNIVFVAPGEVAYLGKSQGGPRAGQDTYVSHFATCPFAKSFRS